MDKYEKRIRRILGSPRGENTPGLAKSKIQENTKLEITWPLEHIWILILKIHANLRQIGTATD